MPDTHVLDNTDGTFTVALHYPIPDLLNEVGINYRDALIDSGIGLLPSGRRTVLDDINPAEESLLNHGSLCEHRVLRPYLPDPNELQQIYIQETEDVFLFLHQALRTFGEPNMALLDSAAINQIHADIMRYWSNHRVSVPITKPELRQLVVIVDGEAENSDIAVIQAIPSEHPGRQWLIDNQSLARRLKVLDETKRVEVL